MTHHLDHLETIQDSARAEPKRAQQEEVRRHARATLAMAECAEDDRGQRRSGAKQQGGGHDQRGVSGETCSRRFGQRAQDQACNNQRDDERHQ